MYSCCMKFNVQFFLLLLVLGGINYFPLPAEFSSNFSTVILTEALVWDSTTWSNPHDTAQFQKSAKSCTTSIFPPYLVRIPVIRIKMI